MDSRKAGIGVFLAAVTAASGLVAAAGPAVSAVDVPVSLTLEYRCAFPLIGTKDIRATIKAELPAEAKVGVGMPIFDVAATTEIGADTTEGLYTMNAAKLEGSAIAKVRVFGPGPIPAFGANTTVNLTPKDIPESGPFSVEAAGRSPRAFRFDAAGWARINVGNLDLTVTPKDAAGNATALGTLNVPCFQKPGQKNQLHAYYVRAADETPGPPPQEKWPQDEVKEPAVVTFPRHVHSATLTYTCTYPVIGPHPITVRARLEDYPAGALVGQWTPRIVIDSVNSTDEETSEGLQLLDPPAATLEGKALAWATLTAPEVTGGPLAVRVKMPLPKSRVAPLPPKPTVIEAKGSAPALTFAQEGDVQVRIGNLDITMTPKTADGRLTEMGTIRTTCTRLPGQDNLLATINIRSRPDTTPPSTPGAPAVTGRTDTTVGLSWGAATDDLNVAGYDVYAGTTKVASTYGAGTRTTVTGLRPSTGYTLTVKARDSFGNRSVAAGPPVSVRTNEVVDTAPPAVPARPSSTGKTFTSVSLAWRAPADNVGVTGYEVYTNGKPVLRLAGTKATLKGLQQNTGYNFRIKARDKAGNVSGWSDVLTVRTNRDTKAPTVPGKPRVTGKTPRTVTLAWRGSTDNLGIAGYNVLRNGRLALRVAGTRAVLTDLRPGTGYTFKVRARDKAGNLSGFSRLLTVRTPFAAGPLRGGVGESPFDLFLDTITPGQSDATGLTLLPGGSS